MPGERDARRRRGWRGGGDGGNGAGPGPEQRFLEPRSPSRAPPRDIAFCLVEGDFQARCLVAGEIAF